MPASAAGGSPLRFLTGSHADKAKDYWCVACFGHDDATSRQSSTDRSTHPFSFKSNDHERYDPHEADVDEVLLARYPHVDDHSPLALGDATFHHGWVLHGSPPNKMAEARVALSFAYTAADAKTLGEEALYLPDHEDEISYEEWVDEVGEGNAIEHPLTPLVYP